MLEIINLGKKRGGRWVLKEIDLTVNRGETFVILGPNGSGKSTLLECLTGAEQPDEGKIYWDGKELSAYSLKEKARKMAVLTQETGHLDAHFQVEDLVRMGRFPHQGKWPLPTAEDEEITERAMREADVFRFRDRWLMQLSGGERQRVSLARILAQEANWLILDEPTTYLDIQYQVMILELLKKWQREKGLTLILVLHDVNLAAQVADRLLFLKDGRVQTIGTPDEVVSAKWIEKVYGIRPMIIPHPESGVPQVLIQAMSDRPGQRQNAYAK